ncbi:hypothetical protein L4X63_17285 [Geomonas sp. Red32]|uniref:hypothetical protein n=1 Tax=Geomonas sp. Red32 TaxID=2912856 RepID=UPI00202CCF1B|nr:hypothetical protein [Geomonas sp. Red32]MCM0083342.1 hypothetical protein [Geomonas sp. Red32]
MVEKELLTRVGMFPVGQRRGEDLDTWVRLLCEVPLVYCSKPGAVVWDALPASACVACNDIYVDGNHVLEILETMAAGEGCPADEREIIHDYLAWYLAGPVERLLAARQGAWARRYIVPALRSRRFRLRFLGMYLKSLLVKWAP